jgi:hypothetical protein
MELPDDVKARKALPLIVRSLINLMIQDRLTWDQLREMGALDIGSWKITLA